MSIPTENKPSENTPDVFFVFGCLPVMCSSVLIVIATSLRLVGLVTIPNWLFWMTSWGFCLLVLVLCWQTIFSSQKDINGVVQRPSWKAKFQTCLFLCVIAFGQNWLYRYFFPTTQNTLTASETDQPQNQIAQADAGILRLQQRRAKLIPLLEKATAEKDELVAKLQDAGVTKASDIKSNSSARNYAAALQKLATDIRNLQLEVSRIDEAITHANGIKRRLEQKDAGVTDEELAALTAESGAMDSPTAGDPASLDAILTQELQGKSARTIAKPSKQSLVGKWEIIEGEKKGTATFTSGGTIQFVWCHSSSDRMWNETGKYTTSGNKLTIKASGDYGSESNRDFEFISENELLVNKPTCCDFNWLYGRLRRVQ